jgi:hypothetical protein
MAFDYDNFVASIANLTAMDPSTLEFQQMIPNAITYAEKRIYRELDVIDSVWRSTANLTAGSRIFEAPPAKYGGYITFQGVNVLIANPVNRIQLQPIAMSYLNAVWGTPKNSGVPQYFALYRQDEMMVGPWPDQPYEVEVFGTYRPEPMSPTHQTTYLTEYLPDVLLAAAMIFVSGWMRDFGSQADNPQQAQSWETQYQALSKGALLESLRQKFAGPGWTSLSAIPVAQERG